jgi:polysaccharide deacetylase family protein (PEP-CTERM system associated)
MWVLDTPKKTFDESMHAFSIDVEDWYQGVGVPMRRWNQFEPRVRRSMTALLDLMAEHDVRATCFVLGKVAEEHPQLVQDIHAAGHEVATHGYAHKEVYDLSQERFRSNLQRSIRLLQDVTGEAVVGYRAPYFTITRRSLWAIDVLAEEGIRYDSSIHPVLHWRYGIPEAGRDPSSITAPQGQQLLEVPVSTFPLVDGVNLPVAGGAYLRIYPYWFWRACLKRLEARCEHLRLYVHPWELDPEQPRIALPWRTRLPHYFNLSSTRPRLAALFEEFEFRPYRDVFSTQIEEASS